MKRMRTTLQNQKRREVWGVTRGLALVIGVAVGISELGFSTTVKVCKYGVFDMMFATDLERGASVQSVVTLSSSAPHGDKFHAFLTPSKWSSTTYIHKS